jgi:hypothetical protein
MTRLAVAECKHGNPIGSIITANKFYKLKDWHYNLLKTAGETKLGTKLWVTFEAINLISFTDNMIN